MGEFPITNLRRPVQTLYGGAHLYKAGATRKMGEIAQRALAEYAPDANTLAQALEIPDRIASTVYERVARKLQYEAVEDYRIDFEDGYGSRPDDEEDAAALNAGLETAIALSEKKLTPFFGIRIKAFEDATKFRAVKTLRTYVGALLEKSGGTIPENFVVTLPKISAARQVSELIDELDEMGDAAIKVEIMVETPQAIFILPRLVEAARGRCVAAHFGPYDYTASLGITSAHQDLHHPACDFARSMMLTSLAGTGVRLADGPTNLLPTSPDLIHRAWKRHYDNIRRSMYNGFYQSWDLHPAQLPARYAAVYSFFLEGLEEASDRMKRFLAKAFQATQARGVFDDAATGQGLLNYFVLAIGCGAISEADVAPLTGLTAEELRIGSFDMILKSRK